MHGKSGEYGCLQYLPATWKQWSREVLGYSPTQTPVNELYVAARMIEKWLDAGHTPREIALIWNAGSPVERKGVNKHGVAYDSGHYAQLVINNLR